MKRTVFNAGVWLLVLAVYLQAGVLVATQPDPRADPVRWAVICTSDLQELGVSDLLTAQLSEEGFELVERERLYEVIRELELGRIGSVSAGAERLQVAAKLNADRLVLISSSPTNAGIVQIVICECDLGVRLHVYDLERLEMDVEQLASQCMEQVVKTRDRFAGEVKQIVGIAPFQSKNLVHDYDHFQMGWQRLSQVEFLARQGVVAIEIEEARLIQKELLLSKKDKVDRIGLLLLEGEFLVFKSEREELQVELKLKATTASGFKAINPEVMSFDALSEYLRRIPGELLEGDDQTAALSSETQFEWLCEQADCFAIRGDFAQSASLLEAALLLEPGSASVRNLAVKRLRCVVRISHACKGSVRVILKFNH